MAAIGQSAGGEAATQQGEGQQQQQQGADLSALTGALEGLQQGQESLRDFLQSNPWAQAQEPAEPQQQAQEPPQLDLSWLDTGDPALDQQIARQMAEVFTNQMQQERQHLTQQFEERFGALDERLTERERAEGLQAVISEFPEMGDQGTFEQIINIARNYAEGANWPSHVAEYLAADPYYMRLIYMAGRAADAHNGEQEQEGSGDPGAAHLEGGGGANPGVGGQGEAGDEWLRRMNSEGMGHRALPFH